MTRKHAAAALMIGVGLSGCDTSSNRDVTAPDPGVVTVAQPGKALVHVVVRASGEAVSTRRARSGPNGAMSIPEGSAMVGAAPAAATVCDAGFLDPTDGSPEGGLTGGTYSDIEVPPGKICVLQDATVTNSVTALAGSRLFVRNSQIGGNVQGLSASAVQVSEETTIAGDMIVLNANDTFFASCSADNASILGDLTCQGNNPGSPIIRAEQGPTVIGGSIHLVDNVIPAGHVLLLLNSSIGVDADVNTNTGPGFKGVNGNTVAGKLQCKRNDATFSGGPNTAGKAKGQCF
ncbi:MAG: hypothetical protein ACREOQ_00565 [Gemmatimonadales bacterium]